MGNLVRPWQDRFWAKVDKTGDCWLWTASKTSEGYGLFRHEGRTQSAHRVIFVETHGAVPEGCTVDHVCGNRSCVSPEHLRAATPAQQCENRKSWGKSGVRGVRYRPDCNRWEARVRQNGKEHYLGLHLTEEAASVVAIAKRNELFTHNKEV